METPILTVRVPEHLLKMLEAKAAQEHRSRSAMLVLLLQDALDLTPAPTGKEFRPSSSDGFGGRGVATRNEAALGCAS